MKIKDVIEWIQIADDDIYSAQILNESFRKPHEIICYHCAQATEKYLKGYLAYKDIIPPKTHNLLVLQDLCIEQDTSFENIRTECSLLNRFANEIRYPHRIEIKEEDVDYSLNAVDHIKNHDPIKFLRAIISNENIKENNQ
jgi:HEPN domain-containing protein